ncbi:MAG TPA: glutamine synthetase family protein [Bryobacteraceae bacterium]|nr:glutamine synthetase family protein [Bryobacteraceae bacterium]
MEAAEVRALLEKHTVRRVKLGAFDIDGALRGKYVSTEKFLSAAGSGLGFCDVVFGWDIGDVLYDNAKFTGWHTGYPDAHCRIALDTFRMIPWEPGTAFFLMDFLRDGRPLPIAPRQVLDRVANRAAELGYAPTFSAEYEFFFFRETAESLRAKNFRNLTPLSPGMFGYSVLRASANSTLVLDLLDQLAEFRCPLEGLHTETGPGVYEAAIAVDDIIAAADKAALFKTAVKEIAARHGLIPTFMAKWNAELPGSSGHLHQSLWDREKHKNLFHADSGMSPLMQHYLAGLVANLPELAAVICPTVNSYKRTVPGAWAPVNATWGIDNRTTAVRAIPGSAKSTRVELRLSGADINPYLAMAASLAAGLDGIERKLALPPATVNAYAGTDAAPLPRTLSAATKLFRDSIMARCWLGDEFVDHYTATRDWEVRQFEKAVTDWELARYFESI